MGCGASQDEIVEVQYLIMQKRPPPIINTANQYYVKQPP